jgi:hypothetical protein
MKKGRLFFTQITTCMKKKKEIGGLLFVAILTIAHPVSAQLRTGYFMDKSVVRTTLNPAFQGDRTFVSIPLAGSLSFGLATNGLALDDVLIPQEDGTLKTILNSGQSSDAILSVLRKTNRIDADFRSDIVQAGWRHGKGFWTIGAALRGDFYTSLPKDLFRLLVKAESGNYDMGGTGVDARSWLELSAGYSRPINDKLTVGGKLKLLPALAGVKVRFDKFDARLTDEVWQVDATGMLNVAVLGGAEPAEDEEDGFLTGLESPDSFSPSPAGFGAAVDLGATYQLLDNLTLSASILDLGFISWSKGIYAESAGGMDLDFEELNFLGGEGASDKLSDEMDGLMELAHFYRHKDKSFKSALATTLLIGGEYTFFDNRLSAGLLSSTRFAPLGAYTELTASANYRPTGWFAATVSYSAIHSDFKTFGWAINFSPAGFNFFLGSDYMLTKTTPQFIPVRSTAANIHLGMAVQW